MPSLVLGTVQLGVPYGVANERGLPSEAEAVEILCRAARAGVGAFDTARAYGESERRIGLALSRLASPRPSVITKLAPHDASGPGGIPAAARADDSLERSLEALGLETVETVLLHRARDLLACEGGVWRRLIEHRDAGRIGRLGISVQSPAELSEVLLDREVRHVQLPFNLLDRRWGDSGAIAAIRARPDVTVHIRSAFLQGLLAGAPAARWPAIPGVDPDAILAVLAELADRFARVSLADLCLAFVRAHEWIDGVVVGVESFDQLEDTVSLFAHPRLAPDEVEAARSALPASNVDLLDPARWAAHALPSGESDRDGG